MSNNANDADIIETREDSYIDTPVHKQSLKFLFASIPKRIVGLVSKLIGVKIALFGVATFLFISYPAEFPWYAWVIVYLLTLFGRDGLKFIEKIKK